MVRRRSGSSPRALFANDGQFCLLGSDGSIGDDGRVIAEDEFGPIVAVQLTVRAGPTSRLLLVALRISE